LLILEVIADDWLAGAKGESGRGFEIGADGRCADYALMPTNTCPNEQPILRRQVLQHFAKLCRHPLGRQASSLIQQLGS
jgi:hypothetical protein